MSIKLRELNARWGGDNAKAWRFLSARGFTHNRRCIIPPRGHKVTEEEDSAISYLWLEWGWTFKPLVME